jgi:arylsulfatase A-like enzyme
VLLVKKKMLMNKRMMIKTMLLLSIGSTLIKRRFISMLALTGLAFYGLAATVTAREAAQPDILLIMPDQWRGDALSILNCSGVNTPQLDQLASEGALFRRAYATVPSCIPARYGMLTGLFPQTSGVVGYTTKTKPITVPTLPGMLSQAGYHTVLVGRNMHQVKASGSCGYDQRILGSTYIDNDEYGRFLRQVAPQTGGILKLIHTMGVTINHWQAKPWPLKDQWHPTEWVIKRSREIVAQEDDGNPLFLTASFLAPHPPLFPPRKHYQACLNKDLPGIARGDWVNWDEVSPEGDRPGQRVLLEGEVLRKAQAGYYGLIDHIDEQIAPLIRDFKARSEKAGRPWVIVFTSDHGEMLGDHGYFRKCEPFEGSANVPLLITGSKAMGFSKGIRSEQPVCLEDLMPTMLAMAGSDIPGHLDGENLLPTLRGDAQKIRNWLHFEHAKCYSKEQAFHALTDGEWKYIWRPHDGREHLFNLAQDPREEKDLSGVEANADTLSAWRARLIKRLKNRPEQFVQEGILIAGRPYRPLNEGTRSGK